MSTEVSKWVHHVRVSHESDDNGRGWSDFYLMATDAEDAIAEARAFGGVIKKLSKVKVQMVRVVPDAVVQNADCYGRYTV